MARIPEQDLARLKREIPIRQLAEEYGIRFKRSGQTNWIGLCPFHNDTSPSFVATDSTNLWNCLGACSKGGSVIDFVMQAEKLDFLGAVRLLWKRFPALAPAQRPKRGTKASNSSVPLCLDPKADDQELLRAIVGYYHEVLKLSPQALGYLEARGLGSGELIDRFQLGYADRTLGPKLSTMGGAGAMFRERLKHLGLFRSNGREHLNGSLVIPVFDHEGNVTELYGRKVGEKYRPGTPLHLYLPGPHRGVWNIEALARFEELVFCESFTDALSFWNAGYHNVTASYGIQGFTSDHLEALRRHGTRRVLIAYDRDKAGDQAAAALAKQLTEEGIDCFRIQFPRGMDANEYALKVRPAKKSLGLLIRKAQWLGNGQAPELSTANEKDAFHLQAAANTEEGATKEKRLFLAERSCDPGAVKLEPERSSEEASGASGRERQERTSTPIAEKQPSPLVAESVKPQRPAASPLPPKPDITVKAQVKEGKVFVQFGDRAYRVVGLEANRSPGRLRVNVRCTRGGELHSDTLDLCLAKQRSAFARQAAALLGAPERVFLRDLGRILLKLEELQEQAMAKELQPKNHALQLSESERAEALALLRSPKLIERILEDFDRCGLVGEETNKLTAYLAAVSRKLRRPLGIIVQSASAAGKSALMDAVLAFMPEEECRKYSALTSQSLYYMSQEGLKHKILAIVEQEGAQRAAYALKLLQSEGELSIASPTKDPESGQIQTKMYRVEGPVMSMLSTTTIELDEELQNRNMVLTVDEGREQTRAIHRLQRERQTLEGYWAERQRKKLMRLHQNAQRLLEPVPVFNPYARELRFLDEKTRTRRDHEKYLTLIRSITLLHQHQRPRKVATEEGESVEYIEATVEDIELANRLVREVLGRSLDELPPQTRRFLHLVEEVVREACARLGIESADYRFTRRQLREATGWSYDQVRIHLARLVELEYVLVHRGSRGLSFVYELLYDGGGKDGEPYLIGLINVEALRGGTGPITIPTLGGKIGTLGGRNGRFGPPLDPHLTPIGPPLEGRENGSKLPSHGQHQQQRSESAENACTGQKKILLSERDRNRKASSQGTPDAGLELLGSEPSEDESEEN